MLVTAAGTVQLAVAPEYEKLLVVEANDVVNITFAPTPVPDATVLENVPLAMVASIVESVPVASASVVLATIFVEVAYCVAVVAGAARLFAVTPPPQFV
jgi:hypothetical protein